MPTPTRPTGCTVTRWKALCRRNTISSYERGRSQPNHEMLIRIAELFDVSLDYLLGLRRDRVSYKEQNNVIVVPKSLPKREYPKIEEYIQFLLSHQDKNG